MESGKRASMREGPLAALFRKTDEEGASKAEVRAEPVPEPEPERREPNPREATNQREPAAPSVPEYTPPPREAATPPREPSASPAEAAKPPAEAAPEASPAPRESISRYDGVPSSPFVGNAGDVEPGPAGMQAGDGPSGTL